MKGSSKHGDRRDCEGDLVILKYDGEGGSENTRDVRERCDGSQGNSEHIKGTKGKHAWSYIVSGQDDKAVSEHDDVVEIDQPVNSKR